MKCICVLIFSTSVLYMRRKGQYKRHLIDLEKQDVLTSRKNRIDRVRRKFDLSFHPNMNRRRLSQRVLQKFVVLDSKLGGTIEKVYLTETFDGTTGYVIVFNDKMPLSTALFDDNPAGIAKCLLNFEVIGGRPECPNEICAGKIAEMFRVGEGPSLLEHLELNKSMSGVMSLKRNDSSEWAPHLADGDFFSIAHSATPPKNFRMFSGITSAKSSMEFFELVRRIGVAHPSMTFVEFFMKFPALTIHLKNAKRNAMRAAYEISRFMKIRMELRRDNRAFRTKGCLSQTLPVMAVMDFHQIDNVLIPYSGFDASGYSRHVAGMHMGCNMLPAFNMSEDHDKKCLVYYCGASPLHFNDKTEWRGFTVVDGGEQYISMNVPIVPDIYRFIAVPTTYPSEKKLPLIETVVEVEEEGEGDMINDEERPLFVDKKQLIDPVTYPEPPTINSRMSVVKGGRIVERSYSPRDVNVANVILGNPARAEMNVYHCDFKMVI